MLRRTCFRKPTAPSRWRAAQLRITEPRQQLGDTPGLAVRVSEGFWEGKCLQQLRISRQCGPAMRATAMRLPPEKIWANVTKSLVSGSKTRVRIFLENNIFFCSLRPCKELASDLLHLRRRRSLHQRSLPAEQRERRTLPEVHGRGRRLLGLNSFASR